MDTPFKFSKLNYPKRVLLAPGCAKGGMGLRFSLDGPCRRTFYVYRNNFN